MEAPSSIAAGTEPTIADLKVNELLGLSHVANSSGRTEVSTYLPMYIDMYVCMYLGTHLEIRNELEHSGTSRSVQSGYGLQARPPS